VFKEHPRRSGIGDENMASTKNRDILLVGGMRLASAEDVFRTLASLMDDKVHRIPDGEMRLDPLPLARADEFLAGAPGGRARRLSPGAGRGGRGGGAMRVCTDWDERDMEADFVLPLSER
jgi:hypothetical protein